VWSLGIILYCLLVGTLPFDDDDEEVMRSKIVKGVYEEPDWLSEGTCNRSFSRQHSQLLLNLEVLDLLRHTLQQTPSERLTIPQILGHPWFTNPSVAPPVPSPSASPAFAPIALSLPPKPSSRPLASEPPSSHQDPSSTDLDYSNRLSESATSAASDATATSDLSSVHTPPTTPDAEPDYNDRVQDINDEQNESVFHDSSSFPTIGIKRNESETTLRKGKEIEDRSESTPRASKIKSGALGGEFSFATVPEEVDPPFTTPSAKSNPPSSYPTRTPVRTKRRSVSSNLSAPSSPTDASPSRPDEPTAQHLRIEYVSLLSAPAPLAFSTALERDLLSSLSSLGFDTAQIVHSVLTDACDATGAIWWMLKKKSEKRAAKEEAEAKRIDEERKKTFKTLHDRTIDTPSPVMGEDIEPPRITESPVEDAPSRTMSPSSTWPPRSRSPHVPSPLGLQSASSTSLILSSAPNLTLVPATPIAAMYSSATETTVRTPPRIPSPSQSQTMLSAPTSSVDSSIKSAPTTPSGGKDKDSKGRPTKPRSGSISVLQRAAGLVRKKSDEKVKERDGSAGQIASVEEPTKVSSSHGPNKLTKSPPPLKDRDRDHIESTALSSPWVFANRHVSPIITAVADDTLSELPNVSKTTLSSVGSGGKGPRNRANLLTAFSRWFDGERRKIKGKSTATDSRLLSTPNDSPLASSGRQSYKTVRGGLGDGLKKSNTISSTRKRHGKKPSVSSRRSSSVNSRRSSIASVHRTNLDLSFAASENLGHQNPRRSLGSRTPTSEKGDFSSRPSSVRSFSIAPLTPGPKPASRTGINIRSASPGGSSAGSGVNIRRTDSPLQQYHRRAGSGGSTRVVRQLHSHSKPSHVRSNSTTSSIRSLASSRPGSFHEASENDISAARAGSPSVASSRRHSDERRVQHTVLVAQKKTSPFTAPSHGMYSSIGRSSWKKAWGAEPPGWSSRSMVAPRDDTSEMAGRTKLRDVFSSLNVTDESDWVDEDDEIPAFAGGLGQRPTSLHIPTSTSSGPFPSSPLMKHMELPVMQPSRSLTLPSQRKSRAPATPPEHFSTPSRLSPLSYSHGYGRDGTHHGLVGQGHVVTEVISTSPPEPSTSASNTRTRRQLPTARNGPAFRASAIQEEDEDEGEGE
jgi:hypothetical protein